MSDLAPEQHPAEVWSNAILCSNCGDEFATHCMVHYIPCCPGKCPGVKR